MHSSALVCSLLLVSLLAVRALPLQGGAGGFRDMEVGPDPEYVMELIERLGQSIIRANDLENSKRGLDLGLSRGFSGSQAAKHLMGLAAANYAGGPGRRRRDLA
ncbi:diuretic hormone class 2 [Bacillus rossius redtenbacheri]|uniref:diuretic hormone class 2 n=1 Tax=Bacillus rossius redtenbacheri TaxID=93214 RepID=UPI002FDE9033